MNRPDYLMGVRWDLSTADRPGLAKARIEDRELHARALRLGLTEEAIRRAPAALAARYALPLRLDWSGLYCPTSGRLLAQPGPDRGGKREGLPGLDRELLKHPGQVVFLDAVGCNQQLRALDLLLAVAAWFSGAGVAGYRRSKGKVWYSPTEIKAVVEDARYLALNDQLEDERWHRVLTLARQLCAHWRNTLHPGENHASQARIAWAVAEIARRQHPNRAARAA